MHSHYLFFERARFSPGQQKVLNFILPRIQATGVQIRLCCGVANLSAVAEGINRALKAAGYPYQLVGKKISLGVGKGRGTQSIWRLIKIDWAMPETVPTAPASPKRPPRILFTNI